MLRLGKSLVVILNYALTAEQPDPYGPEPYSPGKRPWTRSPLGEGPVMPRVVSQNKLGGPDLPRSPGSPYTIRTAQRVEPTLRLGPEPPRDHRCGHARGTAWLPLEDSPTYRIQCCRRKCALPQQSPRRLLPGCTVDRMLPRRIVQSLAPSTLSVYYASWKLRLGLHP